MTNKEFVLLNKNIDSIESTVKQLHEDLKKLASKINSISVQNHDHNFRISVLEKLIENKRQSKVHWVYWVLGVLTLFGTWAAVIVTLLPLINK